MATNKVEVDGFTIEEIPTETPLYDVMNGASRWEIGVHEHGKLALVDCMPRMVPEGHTADFAIVQAARVSYGQGTKKVNEDRGLLRYLLRHQHTTPFEMVEFKFHCVMPMFVARQWIRHRTANVNEYSARYSILPDRFYRPEVGDVRKQGTGNRQGGDEIADEMTAQEFLDYLETLEKTYEDYEKFLEKGVTRELARIALPVSCYTEWYWKCDLHNVLHFLHLRMDSHAQKEIRDYACAMFALVKKICPVSAEAFIDYKAGAIRLTRLEIEAIRTGGHLATKNKREQKEWEEKKKALGLDAYTFNAAEGQE